jgi:hypothetical protein
MSIFLRRMRLRATIVFYRAYYRNLLKTHYGPVNAVDSP